MWIPGRRKFQAEALANAKLLKWGQQKQGGQSGWSMYVRENW